MTTDVLDLRKGERFIVAEPVTGSFGAAEVALKNISLGGAQINHPQPLRIGTRAKLWFKRGDIVVATAAKVVWSHLVKTASGTMVYTSGLRLESADPTFAAAINAFVRAGVIRQDMESLDRKRARQREREEARKTHVRIIPTSEPIQ